MHHSVGAIEGVKKAFGLGAMWAGDPCLLKPDDWLLCSADPSPRITVVYVSALAFCFSRTFHYRPLKRYSLGPADAISGSCTIANAVEVRSRKLQL